MSRERSLMHRSRLIERELGNKDTARLVGWMMWMLLKPFIHIPDKSKKNLRVMDAWLGEDPCVWYWKHRESADGLVGPVVGRRFLGNMDRAIGPMRARYYRGWQGRMMDFIGSRLLHVHVMPVYTHLDEVSEEERERVRGEYYKETNWQMRRPGTLMGVGPGGTRAEILPDPDGVSISYLYYTEENGFMRVFYAPATLVPIGRYKRELRVGEPFYLADLGEDIDPVEETMLKLARITPIAKRGEYWQRELEVRGMGGEWK